MPVYEPAPVYEPPPAYEPPVYKPYEAPPLPEFDTFPAPVEEKKKERWKPEPEPEPEPAPEPEMAELPQPLARLFSRIPESFPPAP